MELNIKPLAESNEFEARVTFRVPRRSTDGAGEGFAGIEEIPAQWQKGSARV